MRMKTISIGLENAIMAYVEETRARRPQTARDLAKQIETAVFASTWTKEDAEAWWGRHERELSKKREVQDLSANVELHLPKTMASSSSSSTASTSSSNSYSSSCIFLRAIVFLLLHNNFERFHTRILLTLNNSASLLNLSQSRQTF